MKEIIHYNLQKKCSCYKKNQKEEKKCNWKYIKKNIKKKLIENCKEKCKRLKNKSN